MQAIYSMNILLSALQPCCTITSCVSSLIFPSHYNCGTSSSVTSFHARIRKYHQIRPGKPPDPLSCGQGALSIILTLGQGRAGPC